MMNKYASLNDTSLASPEPVGRALLPGLKLFGIFAAASIVASVARAVSGAKPSSGPGF